LTSRPRVISTLERYCSSRCRSGSTSHGSSSCPKGDYLKGKSLVISVEIYKVVVLEMANRIAGSSSTSLWVLQDPLITAVATPLILIYYAIIDSTALSAVTRSLRPLNRCVN
jgi:hypothetical protein